jgi:hypothetical protein
MSNPGLKSVEMLNQVLEEDIPNKPMTPQRLAVSGGLTGFDVAQDLLLLDFSSPEQAPAQFRAVPYDAARISTPKAGVSGACWPLTSPHLLHVLHTVVLMHACKALG